MKNYEYPIKLSVDFCRERTSLYNNGENNEEFLVAEKELSRFFYLIKNTYKPLAIPSTKVDDIWHAFILFTPQYRDFCYQEFGEYIDHQPNTSQTPVPLEALTNFYQEYFSFFGEVHPIWYSDFDQDTENNLRSFTIPLLFSKKYRWSGWPGRR